MRQSRKLDHLKYSLTLEDGPTPNGFSDFTLVHHALPDIASNEVDLRSRCAGLPLSHPVIINAITGGAGDVTEINGMLAELARATQTAMAVGSQFAAVECPAVEESYKVVRKNNPDGIIFANIGAHATIQEARQVVAMIEADAIQVHLNVAQEMVMLEGDRDFSHYIENIAAIVAAVKVPVIVKEVGCGISKEAAEELVRAGVKTIDVGGAGGTNFMAIESARSQTGLDSELLTWGIPTAISAVEVASILPVGADFIISGGIRTPLEAVKSLALGGAAVGMATPFIKRLQSSGLKSTVHWLEDFLAGMKRYMVLVGARTIEDLRQIPVVITGYSRDWLTAREIHIEQYATREKHGL
ncbi:fmn-dependent dehydrogenase [Lucifera butyrica]|uniref:Isopentenyl-diphosphate delta-isomerase n=1 Tax=Lucifera butyrica TaxID=1351585 RepID=A0A498R5Q5_9FIRM|nr:type 2 isopentenyl-diphosphate Delta-isomerase [Lucifera butyrica]VBB06170.1 fmn-dependent dehydrogenase [Lucifera butyrica]